MQALGGVRSDFDVQLGNSILARVHLTIRTGPGSIPDFDVRHIEPRMAEAAQVRLRFKLPDGETSRLIERTIAASDMRNARAPGGDFAFAAAVAAYGQLLRGDELMMGFSHDDVGTLAGRQTNFWRQEFLELNDLAGAANPKGRSGG